MRQAGQPMSFKRLGGRTGLNCCFWNLRMLAGLIPNGIWIQHGWLGDDSWFQQNAVDESTFRDGRRIRELADRLTRHGVNYVFPHLCPCDPAGIISSVDPVQTERFLDHFEHLSVMPWIGRVLDVHCHPDLYDRGRFRSTWLSPTLSSGWWQGTFHASWRAYSHPFIFDRYCVDMSCASQPDPARPYERVA